MTILDGDMHSTECSLVNSANDYDYKINICNVL